MRLHPSLVAPNEQVFDPLGPEPAAPLHRTLRLGRTPGWMVLHPVGVKPLGTASWVFAHKTRPPKRPN